MVERTLSAEPAVRGAAFARPVWTADVLACTTVVLLAAVVYAPVRHFGFLKWDDQLYVTANTHVLAGLSWANLTWALTTTGSPYWHPLTWVSHLADMELFGLDAGRHHLTSVFIHAATAVALYALLTALTGARGRSAVAAAIFAVHPVHVESVAWVAERKDVLAGFFSIATLLAYARFAADRRRGWYAATLALFSAALMSKPSAVTLPLVLLLLDVWPLRRTEPLSRRVVEKLPLFALAAIVGAGTIAIQHRVGAVASLTTFPLSLRLQNAATSYVAYLGNIVWPARLAAFYPWDWELSAARTAGSVAMLSAITAVAIVSRRRYPYLFVGWLWYLVALLPVVGLIQSGEQARADRFLYLPLAGVLVAAIWCAADVCERRRLPARTAAGFSALLVLALAVPARAQVLTWSSDLALWQHAVAVTHGNYLAYDLLGLAYRDAGDGDRALESFARARALAPEREPDFKGLVENNIGYVFMQRGDTDQALAHYGEAVRLYPSSPELQYDLGAALATRGRLAEAAARFEAALRLNPASADARSALAGVLLRQGSLEPALDQYRAALRLKPESAAINGDLGAALLAAGRSREALDAFETAARMDPRNAGAENGIGAALAALGREGEAMAHYRTALRLDPRLAIAHANLAIALAHGGDAAGAIDQLLAALRLDPSNASWEYNAGLLLARSGRKAEAVLHLEAAIRLSPASPVAAAARDALRTVQPAR